MSATVSTLYAARIAAGEIESDPAQAAVAERLTALNARLAMHRLARKSSSLGWLFGEREANTTPLRGLYIHGDVGRGKTMLMDLFYAVCPVKRRWRVHFNEFMTHVHDRIHDYRQKIKRGEITDQDPIKLVAADIAQEAWVLCFDEFHVTDIADAMILGRLFAQLFDNGVVVVATSNVDPDELYKDGLNRALFLPFIALLKERMDVVHLAARTDFRLEKLIGFRIWYVPADAAADAAIDETWRRLTSAQDGAPLDLSFKGRVLHVPQAAMGVARFAFHDLCEQPLGAIDYLKIAHEFHTLVVGHIPQLTYDDRNAAKRFILLIDTLYDLAVKLVASAAAAPAELYQANAGFEASEFRRTASRLIEMGSDAYLALPHGRRIITVTESMQGIVET